MADDLNFKGNQVEERADWPQLKHKVAAAFKALEKDGLYTSTEIVGSSGDGEYEVRENLEMAADEQGKTYSGYVYYNQMDEKEARAFGTLSINIGPYVDADTWEQDPKALAEIGQKVVAALQAQGLKTDGPSDVLPNMLTVSLS